MSTLILRNRFLSVRIPRRIVLTNLGLIALLLGVLASGLLGGTYPITLSDFIATLSGRADDITQMVVMDNRMPRLLTAMGVGLAFGLAGEMTQTLLRNPLASPDIIGFSAGAGLGAVVSVAVTGTTMLVLPGALLGGSFAAILLVLLSWNKGLSPSSIVLIGIGLTATLGVVTDLLMTRLDVNDVGELVKWIVGSVSARSWGDTALIWTGLLLLLPVLAWHQFSLARLGFDDAVAISLGQRVITGRMITIFLTVLLVALGVAAAGPLPFVAFVAGPIAHGLNRAPRPTLLTAGLVGALVTLAADRAAQALPNLIVLPAGVFTALIGAPVLIWVLIAQTRKPRA